MAACPAFTRLETALLTPPPEVTASGNPRHYREWVYQEFPSYGLQHVNAVSAWAVHVVQHSVSGLHSDLVVAIDRAIYFTSEGKRIDVLGGLWPQQIIVPYAESPDVAFDLWGNPPLVSLTEKEAALAPCGALGPRIYPRNWASSERELEPVGSPRSIFVKEIRDAGIENTSYNGYGLPLPARPPAMRRGSEVVIWGVSDAGNYDNIFSYHFRDDGEVTALLGPTGWNTNLPPPHRAKSGNTPHSHTVLWRLVPDVAKAGDRETVSVIEYNQHVPQTSGSTERFTATPLKKETGVTFDAVKMTRLRISDPESHNEAAPGKPSQENEYVMTLISDGTPRHRLWSEDDNSTPHFDFTVVRDHAEEQTTAPVGTDDTKPLSALLDGESIVGQDIAIYAYTTIAHIPRAEDFIVHPGAPDYETAASQNLTAVKWSGIRLTPRNIYTRVPFSQPTPGVAATGLSPLPLTRACAPLLASPTLEKQGCEGGVGQYRVGFAPINQNPFGRPATGIEISGPDVVGSPISVPAALQYGEERAIASDQGGVVVRAEAGQKQVCFSVAMVGDDWRCPAETQCVDLKDAACSPAE